MPEIVLPKVSSPALSSTRAGLFWRTLARAAAQDSWSDWNAHVSAELEHSDPKPDSKIQVGHRTISLSNLLAGELDNPVAVEHAGQEFCRGLQLYLHALSPDERIRSAPRLARVLAETFERTGLSLFPYLDQLDDEDQASVWDAVLKALVAREQSAQPLEPWRRFAADLPEHLRERWQRQLAELDVSPDFKRSITSGTSEEGSEAAPKNGAGLAIQVEPSSPSDHTAEVDEPKNGAVKSHDAPPESSLAVEAQSERSISQAESEDSEGEAESKPASNPPEESLDLGVAPILSSGSPKADQRAKGKELGKSKTSAAAKSKPAEPAPRLEVSQDDVESSASEAGESVETGARVRRFEIEGGFSEGLLPAPLRAFVSLTGLVVLVAAARVLLRFFLGFRRHGRLWMEDGLIFVETTVYLFGNPTRVARRSFGPKGLLSVTREHRYPQIFTYIGLFALAAGVFTGTIAFLDGRLAGFEDWILTAVMLVLGGLVIVFLFVVVTASRPGKASLCLRFAPKERLRITGVDRDRAEAVLRALARSAHRPE
ncbi:MAG: hypothetical protein KC561_04480 [Myxococcales bacterium]|nr:hypothetical protein [Myxococcales bacterium]